MLVPVSAPSLAELAAGSLLLEGLRPAEIDNIVAAATRRHVRAQAVITRQGTSADHLYMLVKGRAHYYIDTKKGQKLLMMWVVPGGLIGGAAVTLKIMNYVASTRAVRDSTLLCWDRVVIRELVNRYPRLLDNCLSIAAEYLNWSFETFVGLSSYTASERLAHTLLNLARIIGEKAHDGVELDVTNEELASGANITLYTVSRLLSRWQKQGLVRKVRGRIIVRSPEKLLAQTGQGFFTS